MSTIALQAAAGGQINLNGTNTASTFDLTVPAINSTLATLTGVETLTNKTLVSPTLSAVALGTPASGVMTNVTGLPVSTGLSGLGTGVATALGNAVTGSGSIALSTNPTITNYTESVVAIGNSSTAKTIDLTNGTVQTCTLTGNCTFTMPTATAGKSFILILSTGAGSFTGTFTSVKWPSNTAPTITTTASRWDILTFVADGTNWYGNIAQAYA